jgi:membrane protein YqaA with SNARE-associated domain
MRRSRVTVRMALRDTLKAWSSGPWLYPTSFLFGFLEASFVFLPVEPLVIPMMAGRGRRAWLVAALLLAGNLVAAAMMYWLGANLADVAIEPVMRWLQAESLYERSIQSLRQEGFLWLVLIDLTPVPFQVAMAAAGAALFPFWAFLAAVLIARGVRWFAVAGLVLAIGARAQKWIDDHQLEIFIIGFGVFVAVSLFLWLT